MSPHLKTKQSKFQAYYQMMKPGIIQGNLLTAVAGYLLASAFHINWVALPALLAGTTFIIGSGCVFNNYIDRDIDKKMARIKKRALVQGTISTQVALTFGTALGLTGAAILLLWTNLLTLFAGLVGFFFYVVMYSIFKRRSWLGTLVGSVSGAVPPVAGYVAFSDRLDGGAVLLFLILTCWQMTHFYAIAIYRLKDYKAASIPVLPAVKTIRDTKVQMLGFCILFILSTILLTLFGYAGYAYLTVTFLTGIWWLYYCIQGFYTTDDTKWARSIFLKSLVIITVLSVALSFGNVLP